MTWEEVRDKKLAEREELLRPFSVPDDKLPTWDEQNDVSEFLDQTDLLSSSDKRITQLTIRELQDEYKSGELTVRKATEAFCRRLALAQKLVNCVTEVRFEAALQEADTEDDHFKKTGQLIGPLHGVVVSLKDNIRVKGLATSMGFVGLAEKLEVEDAPMVRVIQKLGGIIVCKSNTSAGMMYSETTNKLWGRTLNPYSRKYLNNGGSSGGEGAIAALRGSCFGVGSDIGGSVRHPAAMNNVYCLKPSVGRVPCYGTASGQPGQESVRTVYGAMSYYLENVQYAMRAIIDSLPYKDEDCSCLPIPYRPYELSDDAKLNIAFLTQDGLTSATPPVLRGLEMVKKALKDRGHNVIEWPATYLKEIREAIYPFYDANGFKSILEIVNQSGEPVDPLLSRWFPTARDMPVSELWELQQKRTALAQKYQRMWNHGFGGSRIDAIIMQSSAFPACLKNGVVSLPCTAIWNGLDYSASTFPVTKCNTIVDKPTAEISPVSEVDKKVHETYAANLGKFEGGPVALQLVCSRLEEEKCLRLTQYVSSCINE